jgi:TPR repeat protein
MSEGSKRLSVKLEGYLPLEASFEDYGIKALEGKTTYVMTISGASVARQIEAPKIKTGWIILESEPSGASVYINDEFVGNTPLNNYKQTYGTYQYRLESPNYHPATGTIELNAGRFEQRIALKPAFGSISVKSNVAGAKILLDGKPTGKNSPATLTEIPSGSHTITLQSDKYAPQQQNVVVEDGQTADVSMSLDARFARITINSLDGAEIYSNGKLVGKGRISEDMMEGYYDLEVRMDHYKSVTKQIQVIAGQSQDITLNPIPKYGSLDIVSTPHNATITIDGKVVGKSPLTINEILEGEHTVQLTLDNFQSETRKITILDNKVETLQFSLNNYTPQYYHDLGVKSYHSKDYSEAAKWFLKAAEQGDADAQYNLALMYENGEGVKKDYKEAVRWYTKAAEQGYASAQYMLGYMYCNGLGVKDYSEALKWYRKAAEQGDADAQGNLGWMYANGLGVSRDYKEAVKWYRKSAEKGQAGAQGNLGWMYEYGLGVSRDYNEAVKWYRKSAEQGNADSQCNLGHMYAQGLGVQIDYYEAEKWTKKSAEQGNAQAKKNLKTIKDLIKMSR